MESVSELLKNNLYFKELETGCLDFLGACASFADYESESFIFSARDPADNFYLILEGKVALQMFSHEKGEIILEERNIGDIIGWSWLKPPYKWQFDAFTVKKTRVLVFDAGKIKKQMETDLAFGYNILKIFFNIVIDRMQATRHRLLEELGDNIYIPD
jgi:CRP/FNR family cyclic AMP-dependent transcriptional regulator